MLINVINVLILLVMYSIYKKLPKTESITIDYFNQDIKDFESIPTY